MKLTKQDLKSKAENSAHEYYGTSIKDMRDYSTEREAAMGYTRGYIDGFIFSEKHNQWVPLPAPHLPEGRYDLWDKETGSRLVNIGLDRRDLENGIFGISHIMPVPSPPQTPNT